MKIKISPPEELRKGDPVSVDENGMLVLAREGMAILGCLPESTEFHNGFALVPEYEWKRWRAS